MVEKVLVPVDLSVKSRYALRCLRYIPGLNEVVILHVVYNRYPPDAADRRDPDDEYRRSYLEEIRKDAELPGVTVRTITEVIRGGEIFQAINRIATQEDVTLTVMGKRGRGIIGTLLLGSVASDILRYGKTDLLLVNNNGAPDQPCPDLFSHALVCTDFSEPEITSICCDTLPWIRKATIFHAVTTGDSPEEIQSSVDAAQAGLERMQDAFARIPIPAQVHVSVGSAPEEIMSYAKGQDVSIIIMKSTGKRSFLQNLLGSTTARVARNAKKPVLVLKSYRGHTQ